MSRLHGTKIEELACQHLEGMGLELVWKNFLCKVGEIDLIMCDAAVLVFVEVRYRKNDHYGSPAATVTIGKQRKLIRAAQFFLQRHKYWAQHPCRFDVIAVQPDRGDLSIKWIKHAFTQ